MIAKIHRGASAIDLETPLSDNDGHFIFIKNNDNLNDTVKVRPNTLKAWLRGGYRGNCIHMWHLYECVKNQPNVVEGDQDWYEDFKELLDNLFTPEDFWKYINYTLNFTEHYKEDNGKRAAHYYGLLELYKKYKNDGDFSNKYISKEKIKDLKVTPLDDWPEKDWKYFKNIKSELGEDQSMSKKEYKEYFNYRHYKVLDNAQKIDDLFNDA